MNGAARRGTPADDPLAALCDRVRGLAQEAGAQALAAARQQAESILGEARRQAETLCQAELVQARTRLRRQKERAAQDSRLQARARLARFRWAELDGVLDEAERQVLQLRRTDRGRYAAALARFFQAGRQQLAGQRLLIRANAEDLALLREYLAGEIAADRVEFVEADIPAGLVLGSPSGDVLIGQSIRQRRQRLDYDLRLAAAEILFEGERS
jgi:vacuolar-type H+-ATPase subunit E/Vma4